MRVLFSVLFPHGDDFAIGNARRIAAVRRWSAYFNRMAAAMMG